jgi:carbon-monoxide dehydrogenase large subunit
LEKVTGKAMFTADFKPLGLYLKAARSPYAHARILSIDTSAAERLPGVRGVIKPEDVPDKRYGSLLLDRYVLPRDNIVRFVGEAVVLVAADTVDIAEEAVELVKVNYEELPAVFDVEEAIKKEPPVIIHPDRPSYTYTPSTRYPEILDPDIPNLQNMAVLRTGDVDKGFREADLIVENRYFCEPVQHCPIETHISDAWIELDGLTVRSSRQELPTVRSEISRLFDITLSKVRVIGPYCGGGFGSKIGRFPEHLVALAAMKLGKPVRLQYNRGEDLTTGGRRPSVVVYLKHGVKKDGTLLALEVRLIIDGGAFGADTMICTRVPISTLSSTYRIPNVKLDVLVVYTNLPPACAMRGVESPQAFWAVEQQMDIIAEKLGIDLVELRRKNILNEGEVNAMGQVVESIGQRECLDKAAEWIRLAEKPRSEGNWVTGKGIAIGSEMASLGHSSGVVVKVQPDGYIEAYYGGTELGQGASTLVAQIVAEELGVSFSRIRVYRGDTTSTPLDWGARGSRTTINTGNAARRACQDAKEEIFRLASSKMGLAPEDLDISHCKIYWKSQPSTYLMIEDLFTPLGYVKGIGEIIGRGEFCLPPPRILDIKTGHYEKWADYGYGAFAVEVGVNLETGEVKVLRAANALDMGQPINPKMCEQQIEGGMGMGIGTALYEALKFDDSGRLLNPDLVNYKIPSAAEIPSGQKVASIIAPAPLEGGPYGAKGFGEMVMSPVAAALGNAVYNAIGVRIYDLPLSRERVLKAIKERANAYIT